MALSDVDDLLNRKRATIGGGSRVPKMKDIRTAPERRFIYRQRDKRDTKNGRKM